MPDAFAPERYMARADVCTKLIRLLKENPPSTIEEQFAYIWVHQKLDKEVTYWLWRYQEATSTVEGRPPPRTLGRQKAE